MNAPPAPPPVRSPHHHHHLHHHQSSHFLEALPPELTASILSHLPARDVLRVEVTSTRLLSALRDPSGPAASGIWKPLLDAHFPWAFAADASAATAATATATATAAAASLDSPRRTCWPAPPRSVFLHLRNLRFLPTASAPTPYRHPTLDFAPHHRTPSLRSMPQRWVRRTSPFSAVTSVRGNIGPVAQVEECDVDCEPVACPKVRGNSDWILGRYNFAVLGSSSTSTSLVRLGAYEVDVEVCFAGLSGGLLGFVACEDRRRRRFGMGGGPRSLDGDGAAVVSFGRNDSDECNAWFFDFSSAAQRQAAADSTSDDTDDMLRGYSRWIKCNAFQGWTTTTHETTSLSKSDSPIESSQKFRLRLNPSVGDIRLYLLDDAGLSIRRKVGRFGRRSVDGSNNVATARPSEEADALVVERMASLAGRRQDDDGDGDGDGDDSFFEFRPFVAFSPMDRAGGGSDSNGHHHHGVYSDPGRSFARVLRVMPLVD